MSKGDTSLEQARAVIDRVAAELGLLVAETSGFVKVQGPSTRHRIYVQRSRVLNRIDTTLPIAADDPAYAPLSSPNGSIVCHIRPDLAQLERCLRMLADTAIATQVPNKPRPFAATKAPPSRRPEAVAAPVPPEALSMPKVDGKTLKERLEIIRDRARLARINRILENPDKYGEMSFDEAAVLIDERVDLAALAEERAHAARAMTDRELAESGVEVVE